MSTDGENLLERAVGGDRDALAQLLERHGPTARHKLGGKIPRRWRPVLSEDDVMQQTYADAIVKVRQVRAESEAAFAAWLAVMARHNLHDALKMLEAHKRGGEHRRIELCGPDDTRVGMSELAPDTATTASGQAARSEAHLALERAVARLPQPYAHVVRMYALEGRPVDEVAAALQRSPGAGFKLRARAHERMRELLGNTSHFFTR